MAKPAPNFIDRAVAYFAPITAIKRAHARTVLNYYEAAQPDRLRKGRRETGSGNDAVLRAGATLRQTARHLEQNYDLALGVLNTLVANVVGPNGSGVEPQPRNADGSINDVLARDILELYKDWSLAPEVTKQHDWPSAQRLLARSWFRDGEVFSQMVSGLIPSLNHGTRVPFSIEMLEADFVPMDLNTTTPVTTVQGVEINAWGAPIGYQVYKQDPIAGGSMLIGANATKRVPAERMLHLKNVHRIRQMRGVSVFASVLNRFDDLKDYEESERIAAKIAASMAAFIKKGSPDLYEPSATDEGQRQMKFRPGMVFDDLRPGEEIGMIDTNRPNPNLETYRSGQLKAIAAGAGPTFSSIARSYDGTYSAQRQELVEGYAIYSTLSAEFIGRIVRPIYEQFIATAIASGALKVPSGVRMETLDDAAYMPPSMPWIDPKKEAEAWGMLEDRCYVSGPEIIRKRGGNPIDTLEQQSRWVREKTAQGIPANAATQGAADTAQIATDTNAALMAALGDLDAAGR
jgi:lambda family phage portal protein